MNDWRHIIQDFEKIRDGDHKAALATVVRVTGSAYRRPGARMLIRQDGTTTGTISGGCLESDVAMRAQECFISNESILLQYSTSATDDVVFGVGLGCNGGVDILVQPLDAADPKTPLRLLANSIEAREVAVLATILDAQGLPAVQRGKYVWITSQVVQQNHNLHPELLEAIHRDAKEVFATQKAMSTSYALPSGTADVFLEFVQPPTHLIVAGAGYDARAMVALAKQLGWRVTVVDPRQAFAVREKFVDADTVLCCSPDQVSDHVQFDARTAAVVMTHNYEHDLAFLRHLIGSKLRYLGMLGPKLRTRKLLTELATEGITITFEQYGRLSAPVGLDIGAETPEEIALAVISEIQALFSGHAAGFLKDRDGPIHESGSQESSKDTQTIEVGPCRTSV